MVYWHSGILENHSVMGFPGGSDGNLPAVWETWIWSLGWEDPLEEGKATLPTPILWPGEFHALYSPWGRKELDTTEDDRGGQFKVLLNHHLSPCPFCNYKA